MLRAGLYFHTLRYLRPRQILYRVLRRLQPLSVLEGRTPELRPRGAAWQPAVERSPSMLGPRKFRFLNETREFAGALRWDDSGIPKLWRYNLHYFDDLNAACAGERSVWHEALIADWIAGNAPGAGSGWEPYPISLRVVNWIKWALAGHSLDEPMRASLGTQLRVLSQRVEWHLLANHLWANAKALLFGGVFFEGEEAHAWAREGVRILRAELDEQVLADGGHFERSPMYHAIVLEDVLDLVNLLDAFPAVELEGGCALRDRLRSKVAPMLRWLEAMCHSDGAIGFFNDAASGVAPDLAALRAYAGRLDIELPPPVRGSEWLESSGYARLEEGSFVALFDVAPVGPDYQPGHAHADTLAFELSVDGERLICNSGTSTYEIGTERDFERSTRAHNTVEVDQENSSEVWAGFRVARRARVSGVRAEFSGLSSTIAASHDGYRRLAGGPIHRRVLEVARDAVRWTDRIEGRGVHRVRGYIPLHPGVSVDLSGTVFHLTSMRGHRFVVTVDGASRLEVIEGRFASEFGKVQARPVVMWQCEGQLPIEVGLELRTA